MKKILARRAMLLVVAFVTALCSFSQTTHPTIYGALRYSNDDVQKYGLMQIDPNTDADPEMIWQDYDMVLTGSGGAVYVDGKTWSARSENGEPIAAGTLVKVERIEGVKAIVAPAEIPAEV